MRQTLRIILFINICDILLLLLGRFGVTYIVNTEAQSFGQVIKPIQCQLFFQPSLTAFPVQMNSLYSTTTAYKIQQAFAKNRLNRPVHFQFFRKIDTGSIFSPKCAAISFIRQGSMNKKTWHTKTVPLKYRCSSLPIFHRRKGRK